MCVFVEIKNAAVQRSTKTHLYSKGYISVQRASNTDTGKAVFTTTTTTTTTTTVAPTPEYNKCKD